jgi:hypothetical protein
VFGKVSRPLAGVECLSGAISNSEASSVRVEGNCIFALRGVVVQLRQQQLPQL